MSIIRRIRFEPAIVSALVVSALIFFGVPEEAADAVGEESSQLVEAISAALVIIGGWITRQQVTPVAKLEEAGGVPPGEAP